MAANEKEWFKLGWEEVMKSVETGHDGLSQTEADSRLKKYGENKLPEPKRKSLLMIFLSQLRNPFIYVLIAAAILSIIAKDKEDAIFIFIIVLINSILGAWQEWKAETNAAALRSMVHLKTKARRDKKVIEAESKHIVPGDVVLLESGMKVPADMRLFEVNGLLIEEALLTGESSAIEKNIDPLDVDRPTIGDQVNMAFAGTSVVKGRGAGIVTGTGMHTEMGKIAKSLAYSAPEAPPLVKRMEVFSRRISIIVVILCLGLAALGWYRGMPLREILFFMIAVGVSAIPEGLPIALTVALSIGTRRMAKRNVIVRKLPAVEGLGSCTLIASDKTGTLTLDEQSVKKIVLPKETFLVEGQGYNGDGNITDTEKQKLGKASESLVALIRAGVVANEGVLRKNDKGWEHSGDAVDVALLALAYKAGETPEWFKDGVEIKEMIPYESERKFSAVYFTFNGKSYFVAKGAAEVIVQRLNEEESQKTSELSEQMAAEGFRVIALASAQVNEINLENLPQLNLLGLVGLIDPLREEAAHAIEKCQKAGIKVVMITGDHPATALTIAKQLKIAEGEQQIIAGKELPDTENEDKKELAASLKDKRVFARVSPLQKQGIVDALKLNGEFVAVTGDGANDAPALKSAHIGIAMGSGTDLAKESASLIVVDDNFASIAAGVEEGRFTYENLRKIIYLLISTGAAEILVVALPLFFGLPLPFIAVQLLWLNLVTNGIQDISLAFERGDPDVMKRSPRSPDENIFDRLMNQQIIVSALIIGLIAYGVWWYLITQLKYDEGHARTLVMLLMVMMQNFHVLNCRSETKSIFRLPFARNRVVLIAIVLAQAIHLSAAYIPGLNNILQLQPVTLKEWVLLLPFGFSILVGMELFKLIRRKVGKENSI